MCVALSAAGSTSCNCVHPALLLLAQHVLQCCEQRTAVLSGSDVSTVEANCMQVKLDAADYIVVCRCRQAGLPGAGCGGLVRHRGHAGAGYGHPQTREQLWTAVFLVLSSLNAAHFNLCLTFHTSYSLVAEWSSPLLNPGNAAERVAGAAAVRPHAAAGTSGPACAPV